MSLHEQPPQLRPTYLESWQRKLGPKAFHKFQFAVLGWTSYEPRVRRIIQIESQFCRGLLPRSFIEGLGVEHQTVHIENDGCDFHLGSESRRSCLANAMPLSRERRNHYVVLPESIPRHSSAAAAVRPPV